MKDRVYVPTSGRRAPLLAAAPPVAATVVVVGITVVVVSKIGSGIGSAVGPSVKGLTVVSYEASS
jgi:hypothetical protein